MTVGDYTNILVFVYCIADPHEFGDSATPFRIGLYVTYQTLFQEWTDIPSRIGMLTGCQCDSGTW